MKRTLLFIMAFLPMLASADPVEIGGICYNLVEETKEAEVSPGPNLYSGDITIPESIGYEGVTYNVTSIGSEAFFNCTGLTSINIPNSVTKIGQSAFEGCLNLVSINIPNSVTEINGQTFAHCLSLTSVSIPDGVTTIGDQAFMECVGITSVSIPDGVTTIGDQAFYECIRLTDITIGRGVKSIGSRAFTNCMELLDVYCYAKEVPETQSTAFQYAPIRDATLHVPAASISAYQAVEPWKNFKEIIVLPEKTGVMINERTFPDSNFRNWVLSQDFGSDGVLTKEELENVTSLDISRLNIHDLKGIEFFTALKDLNCMSNRLTTLNLSENTALEKLICTANELTKIYYLSSNKKLRYLSCVGNNLTTLDVSGCTELDTLACSANQLTTLDVSKNTKLICLECYSNQLTALDLSKNTALRRIHCNDNRLTALDVSNNTALALLVCDKNLLTTLDVTKNSSLTTLTCTDNKLTTLYVSNNKSLEQIFCFNNQLTSLDVSGCTALEYLGCYDNQLTTLNLSGCSALEELRCYNNLLTTLDLSDNTALTKLCCMLNQIKGTGMEALVESLPIVSEGELIVINYQKEQNEMTTTQVAVAKAKGWTPYVWNYQLGDEYAGVDDYLPFVELGKQWHVTSTASNPYNSLYCFSMLEEVERNGKTYVHTCYSDNEQKDHSYELLREENKRVYMYDDSAEKEYLVYDFSLKEGDTFTYELMTGYPEQWKVLKQGWLEDGPDIVTSCTSNPDGTLDIQYRKLRTWTVGREDDETGEYYAVATWVECVGALEGMFCQYCTGGTYYLSFVERAEDMGDHWENNIYLPFSFYNNNVLFKGNRVHGSNMPTGATNHPENGWFHNLTYELEGDRLHVYGDVYSNCGPNNYAYFFEEPTDDPSVHKIEFLPYAAEPVATCMRLHSTDFYVPGFDPNLKYYVIDNRGVEQPVINKSQQDGYLPFVEVGKEWHMVVSKIGQYKLMKYTLSNETWTEDATGKTYFRMYSKDGDAVHDMGLFREEDRKVYYLEPNSTKENLLFDYSLKAGDTYETYSYDEEQMVTYKVLSVNDYTEGPKARLEVYDKESGNMIIQSRYLRKWTVCRTDNNDIQKTWIEGIGSLGGPLENLYNDSPISTCSYLAYVSVNVESEGFIVQFLPFSFYDMYNQVHGSGLSAAADQSSTDWDEQFTFELEGNRLHVHGKTYLNCGCSHYAYFFEEQTEDPFVRKLHFQIQREGVEATCYSFAILDFYVPGFYPEINYTVVDEYGEEYPVFNKMAYRPMIEEGKVWKVGSAIGISDDIVKMVDYYYFDGDTIINGKTCKQMMFQRYVSPDHPDYAYITQHPLLSYVGAWYEIGKNVYLYNTTSKQFKLMYDFSLDANTSLLINNDLYLVGPRQTEGLEGFKGIYRDVMFCANEDQNTHITFWLEGVGGIMGPGVNAFNPILVDPQPQFLMSCTVGDEVIYLNDKYEDGATPTDAEAKKHRFDFTHTIKTKPKTRSEAEEQSLYGEYNNQLLDIRLNPLDDTYLVRITNESDQVVYEKNVNAGSIVGLNIDISAFAKGRYTVTMENSSEVFTGKFETITTGIQELKDSRIEELKSIYNLQGQRLNRMQKGLNIVNGRKVFVK